MKKILSMLFIIILLLGFTGCKSNKKELNKELNIVTSSFPCYDFARAITKDTDTTVEMLLKPGTEMHDYEPTPQDIITISKADIFIYIGGESDEWIDDLLDSIDTKKVKVLRLMDYGDLDYEYDPDEVDPSGDGANLEYDEHIWTGPRNSRDIIEELSSEISKIDPDNKETYDKNTLLYTAELADIDEAMWNIMDNSKRNIVVVGDRFPFKYLFDEYGLSYLAAFPGCSSETEASAKKLSRLIDYTKDNNLPVVFKVDYSNGNIAEAISKETGAKVLTLYSGHNVTEEEFNEGITLTDIMWKNVSALKEALQ